jgi:MoaA/NifB/PqqE/SkfB family radical SAM enzyme
MGRSLLGNLKWLHENRAYRLLLYPSVVRNYLLYQKEMAEKPDIMRSSPPGVEIELTNKCNLACTQCLRSLGLKPYKLGSMDMEDFKKALDQFPYVMHLSLNGFGEPLMAPILWEAVEYAHKVRPWCKILMYTNGMLLTEDNIQKALDSHVTELNVSLDGGTLDTYKKVRRGGKLDVIAENIKKFYEMRKASGKKFPRMGLNFVMLNDNEGELPAFIELGAELGVDYINCITYATYDWGFQNRRTLESYRAELTEAKKALAKTGLECRYFPEWDPAWLKPDRPFMCNFFWGEEFRVSFNGHITLGCCTPFGESYSYGNLFDTPVSQIWNNEKFRANRAAAREGKTTNAVCAGCDKFAREFFDERKGPREQILSVEELLSSTDTLAVIRKERLADRAAANANFTEALAHAHGAGIGEVSKPAQEERSDLVGA